MCPFNKGDCLIGRFDCTISQTGGLHFIWPSNIIMQVNGICTNPLC
jgi:hypothetical protein